MTEYGPYDSQGRDYSQNDQYGGYSETRTSINDEDLQRMMRDDEPSFMDRYGYCIVTFVLIAVNVVVFVIECIMSGSVLSVDSATLINMGAMFAPMMNSPADLYRLVTPMFLHVDIEHLLFNMLALYSVGIMLEGVLGRWNYLLLYFIAGITGNLACYVTSMVSGELVISAGASTSIFGLFVAAALLGVLSKNGRNVLMEYSKGFLGVILFNIIYSLLVPGVSIAGHMGGAIGGLIAMFMVPSKNLRVPPAVRIVVSVIWVLMVVLLLVTFGVF